jgi:hypothetical protein
MFFKKEVRRERKRHRWGKGVFIGFGFIERGGGKYD